MKESDYEKLKQFEEWLLDIDQETEDKKTIERNGTISVIVKSGPYWRIFTTESFSCRAIIVHLNRYCPDYEIVSMRYGEYPIDIIDNKQWRKVSKEDLPVLLPYFQPFSRIGSREALLAAGAPFRDIMNLHYIKCSQNREYPSKRPFSGIAVDHIPFEAACMYGTKVDHPFFVADDKSVYTAPSDILLHYDGKRIEKTVQGKKVKGYLIDRCRLEYKQRKPRKRNV